jgi:hypothetical protein
VPSNISTDDGMLMAVNALSQNAYSAMCLNREFDSIVTDTSDLQQEKQPRSITSTDDGMIISVNLLP